jgi:ATP-dependent 26S proteasome regulatory subunit
MQTHPIADKIARLIRARYPIIAVVSHEESRVQGHIQAIAQEWQTKGKKQPKTLYTWTISQGIRQVSPEPKVAQDGMATADPVAALRCILETTAPTQQDRKGPSAIYLLKDMHRYLPDGQTPGDPVVMRLLRDLAVALLDRHATVILLSPSFVVPPDAEKDIAVVDFPLPTAQELDEQLEAFTSRLSDDVVCDLDDGDRSKIVRALQGLTAVEADACLAQAVIANRRLDVKAIPYILDEKAQIIKQSGALEYFPEQASYADIGGLDLLKAWCGETELAFGDDAREYGLEPPKGLLLVGVPGCGKSLTAKAVSGGHRPLLRLDVGALFGSLVGQSEAQARSALKVAEAVAPCTLWLDEIEKALGDGGGETDGGTSQRVLGTILTWMQETKSPVFIVATANNANRLRPELIQRFSEVFFVDLPAPDERDAIVRIHLGKRRRDPSRFDITAIAEATEGFAGRELERVVQSALRRAFGDGKREPTTEDLLAVSAETVPLAVTMADGIAKMREWAKRARPASSRQASGHKGESGRALEL